MRLLASFCYKYKLALLVPSSAEVTGFFRQVDADSARSHDLLSKLQKLRGSVYLQDHAIRPSDLIDGRHQLNIDQESWHLLVLDKSDEVCGCVRYRRLDNATRFSQLGVSNSGLARCSVWGGRLRDAVESELTLSRRLGLQYVEVGGWALADQIRGTSAAFRMVMATFGLSQVLGGAMGLSTVTRRHGSASILRRIGGRPLQSATLELPAYYDPEYGCEMEVLRFWSWAPNARYRVAVDEIKAGLRDILVLTKQATDGPWLRSPYSDLSVSHELANAAAAR